MKRFIAGVALILCATAASAECNRESSKEVLAMMLEFAKWDQPAGSAMNVRLNKKAKGRGPEDRQKMVEAFANAQACLTGEPIRMKFYYAGKMIADATPEHGIRMLSTGP